MTRPAFRRLDYFCPAYKTIFTKAVNRLKKDLAAIGIGSGRDREDARVAATLTPLCLNIGKFASLHGKEAFSTTSCLDCVYTAIEGVGDRRQGRLIDGPSDHGPLDPDPPV